MARRQIPVHDSVTKPRAGGIFEALAERLGVEQPPSNGDGEQETGSAEALSEQPSVSGDGQGPAVVAASPEPQPASSSTVAQRLEREPRRRQPAETAKASTIKNKPEAEPVQIDPRIVTAKGKQALYIRLPREMHEYLEDLSFHLGKTNRDASMTNLVAQAIIDKYPQALDAHEDEE